MGATRDAGRATAVFALRARDAGPCPLPPPFLPLVTGAACLRARAVVEAEADESDDVPLLFMIESSRWSAAPHARPRFQIAFSRALPAHADITPRAPRAIGDGRVRLMTLVK